MTGRMGELLAQRAAEGLVGRSDELSSLLNCLDDNGPLVVHVHGIGGIGKSTLLRAFAAHAEELGATVIPLDCRVVEPTGRGVFYLLSYAALILMGFRLLYTGSIGLWGTG